MNSMKKALLVVTAVVMVMMIAGCTMYGDPVGDGEAKGYTNAERQKAFAEVFEWDGDMNNRRIDIREIDGIKVNRYGGFTGRGVPHRFGVTLKDAEMVQECELPADAKFVDVEFTLVIHEGIELMTIEYYYDGYDPVYYYKDAEERVYYRFFLVPELDPKNKYFYRDDKDGKIYQKSSKELVPGLWYPES